MGKTEKILTFHSKCRADAFYMNSRMLRRRDHELKETEFNSLSIILSDHQNTKKLRIRDFSLPNKTLIAFTELFFGPCNI